MDGWRAQVHKLGPRVAIYSRRGLDLTRQFGTVVAAVTTMPAVSIVLDAEIVALGEHGKPDFDTLMRRRPAELRFYAFDLLFLDGLDMREERLDDRKVLLSTQIEIHGHPLVRDVPVFDDGQALLAAETMGLEGIVSKRRESRYAPARKAHGARSRPEPGSRRMPSAGGFSNGGVTTGEDPRP